MVHVSDLTWEKRVNHPKEYLKNGDEVEVVVLKLDRNERRISLGIKQLADSPFDAYLKAHPQGSIVTGKVTRFAPFGAFVELAPGLEGLIHISQIDEKRVELPEKALKMGEEVTAKIIATEKKNQKISLSRKEAIKAAEKENIRSYMKKENKQAGMGSMAEAFQALKEKKNG
ncbi:MAG TPA: S1 RNA-binding domain-containing protein, partial [Candidatus Sumerlaeota bacterium]|nr:S1 RNA-binding domain-containing protein [Candidatus Sumerlaeota bacterium]